MIVQEIKETGGAVVALNKGELHALRRALGIAYKYAKNGARRAQRNASTTLVGWAMEAGDYEKLHGEIKVLLERKK
jgi:hypothetical protein